MKSQFLFPYGVSAHRFYCRNFVRVKIPPLLSHRVFRAQQQSKTHFDDLQLNSVVYASIIRKLVIVRVP